MKFSILSRFCFSIISHFRSVKDKLKTNLFSQESARSIASSLPAHEMVKKLSSEEFSLFFSLFLLSHTAGAKISHIFTESEKAGSSRRKEKKKPIKFK